MHLEVLLLGPAQLFQSLSEHSQADLPFRIAGVKRCEHTDATGTGAPGGLPVACTRPRERRQGSRAASNEYPSPHSITSSARARKVGGIVRPSALAAFRLTTSSYLEGACTGRSAGRSPFKMRST